MKVNDFVEVLEGIYEGKIGKIIAIGDAEKSIGVELHGSGTLGSPTWFKPNELKIKKDSEND